MASTGLARRALLIYLVLTAILSSLPSPSSTVQGVGEFKLFGKIINEAEPGHGLGNVGEASNVGASTPPMELPHPPEAARTPSPGLSSQHLTGSMTPRGASPDLVNHSPPISSPGKMGDQGTPSPSSAPHYIDPDQHHSRASELESEPLPSWGQRKERGTGATYVSKGPRPAWKPESPAGPSRKRKAREEIRPESSSSSSWQHASSHGSDSSSSASSEDGWPPGRGDAGPSSGGKRRLQAKGKARVVSGPHNDGPRHQPGKPSPASKRISRFKKWYQDMIEKASREAGQPVLVQDPKTGRKLFNMDLIRPDSPLGLHLQNKAEQRAQNKDKVLAQQRERRRRKREERERAAAGGAGERTTGEGTSQAVSAQLRRGSRVKGGGSKRARTQEAPDQ